MAQAKSTTAKPTSAKPTSPQTVGYLRLKDGIADTEKKAYKAALKKAGATKIVEESVSEFGVRPKFDRTLKALAPGGKLVVIRETHLSANDIIAKGLIGRISRAKVGFQVLKPAFMADGTFGGHGREGDGGGNGG